MPGLSGPEMETIKWRIVVACTVLCILAIWKFTESDAVWRAIATFIVVSIATAIFALVNEKLG